MSESENESRETVADIVAEMRDHVVSAKAWKAGIKPGVVMDFADRIEAAWKREKAEAEANALAVGGIVEAARHKPGNAAAKKRRRTKADDPSKILHDYWRNHYEV